MEVQLSPNIEHLKLLIWILIGLLGVLLSIVGYFINDKYKAQKEELSQNESTFKEYFNHFTFQQKEQLSEIKIVVETLQSTVINLDKVVNVMRSGQEERDPRTEKRLNSHSEKMEKLENRLTILESEHRIAFCKYPPKSNKQ